MGFNLVATNTTGATMSKDNELALDLFMLGYERNELVHMLNEATSLIEALRNELDSIKSELHTTHQELWSKQK
jgi:hypothetical protein